MDSIFHGQYDNDMIFDMRDYDLFAIVLQKNGGCLNMVIASNLVGGLNPSEKYESQLGLLFPICGKIIHMFQTTSQQYFEHWDSIDKNIKEPQRKYRPFAAPKFPRRGALNTRELQAMLPGETVKTSDAVV